MTYLLDTNAVAELTTRPRPDPVVLARAGSVPAADVYLSVITLAEIEAGIAMAPDPARKAVWERVPARVREEYRGRIAVIGEPEALAHLAVHRRLKSAGKSIDPPDALITATAIANGWTLVSRNIKHLARTGAVRLNPWEHQA